MDFATNDSSKVSYTLHDRSKTVVQTSVKGGHIDLAHGSFDNDTLVLAQTLKRIAGSDTLPFPVENLRGF